MNLIPKVKKADLNGETVTPDGVRFLFAQDCDERLILAARRFPKSGSYPVIVDAGTTDEESYTLKIEKKGAHITSNGARGAFYGMMTLCQLLDTEDEIPCGTIEDAPDFPVRGFYHDITRGRVPTLATLKELVDRLAYYKQNMLQLYVEHVVDLPEYDGIYQRTGYLSMQETKELDAYCRENFIELVPSLSSFGHLYELLQNTDKSDLCELENYKPRTTANFERMGHHTINPSDPRSLPLILSMIDRYAECFSTDKFNICCDETFDLCRGRNEGKDKGALYFSFVSAIIDHLRAQGKEVMMWHDILIQHPEYLDRLQGGVTYLNWHYDEHPSANHFEMIKKTGKPQIACPGVSGWARFIANVACSTENIATMAAHAKKYGALGILNTNWGDHLHTVPTDCSMYGMIEGAAKAWDESTAFDESFDRAVDRLFFGYDGASRIMKEVSAAHSVSPWYVSAMLASDIVMNENVFEKAGTDKDPEALQDAFERLEDVIPELMATTWENDRARRSLLVAAEGAEVCLAINMARLTGERLGIFGEDAERWLVEYSKLWLEESKPSELTVFLSQMTAVIERYLR